MLQVATRRRREVKVDLAVVEGLVVDGDRVYAARFWSGCGYCECTPHYQFVDSGQPEVIAAACPHIRALLGQA